MRGQLYAADVCACGSGGNKRTFTVKWLAAIQNCIYMIESAIALGEITGANIEGLPTLSV